MHGYMNKEALRLTIETKYAHYWSEAENLYGRKVKKVDCIKK